MRRLLILVISAVGTAVLGLASPAFAVSAHFNYANVTHVGTDTITIAFKESGLGHSQTSVTIKVTGTAECINGGTKHPKATNKSAESASGSFKVSNGQATGTLTMSATNIKPSCSPPMVIAWTNLVVTDTTFMDSIRIPGTFYPTG